MMQRKISVRINWTKMPQANVAPFAFNTVEMMTGNTYFPEPVVALLTVKTAVENYAKKYGKRKNGANAKAAFNDAKTELFSLLREQADGINAVADGDDNIITSTGFISTKNVYSKAVRPEQPKKIKATYRNKKLTLITNTIKGANSYCWIIFFGEAAPVSISKNSLDIDQNTRYIIIPAGNSREYVSGIPVGADLTIQVLAQNRAGKSTFSPSLYVHTGT